MSVDSECPSAVDVRPRAPRQTGVLLLSLAIGSIAGMVLTLLVLPGATEAVITGSLLLGSGSGWAALAVLSTRSAQPSLGWAWVPAASLSLTGVCLIVIAPRDAAMSAMNWIWPPAALVLTAWVWLQVRRTLRGGGRRLMAAMLVVLTFAATGAVVGDITDVRVRHDHPASGTTYAVGDHRLHIDCRGTGGPTVLLLNGLGEISASWARIQDQVSASARVCAYDRAGQGWSSDTRSPQDALQAVTDLHALLEAAGEHAPYVLVGHSIGGLYALTYTQQFPQDVAGLVLLDSSSPHQLTEVSGFPLQYQLMRRGVAFLPTLSRLGLGPVLTPRSHLPGADGDLVEAMTSTPRAERNGRDEVSMIPTILEQAQALTTLDDRPVAVLTASESRETGGWDSAQDRLAALSTNSLHRDLVSTHAGLLENADGAAASAAAIQEVLVAITTHAPLPPA